MKWCMIELLFLLFWYTAVITEIKNLPCVHDVGPTLLKSCVCSEMVMGAKKWSNIFDFW